MSKRLSILFYLKKQKLNTLGPASIYLRITVEGRRTEISTKRECEPQKWNKGAGRAKGTKEETKVLNAYLDALQTKVLNVQQQLMIENKSLTGESIKKQLFGIQKEPISLITVIEEHNKTIEQLLGKGYTKSTLTKYTTTKK